MRARSPSLVRAATVGISTVGALLAASAAACAATPSLPATLAPSAPFPGIVAQSVAEDRVASGVRFGRYHVMTISGPLIIEAIAIDPGDPTVHLSTVIADDHLISQGESVPAMAARTKAVAGVNGDYFAISSTPNEPLVK